MAQVYYGEKNILWIIKEKKKTRGSLEKSMPRPTDHSLPKTNSPMCPFLWQGIIHDPVCNVSASISSLQTQDPIFLLEACHVGVT